MIDERRPWFILVACILISVGTNAFMIAPASIVPLLVAEFGLGKAGAGTAISVAILGSVLVQLPSGPFLDRYDNRRLMLVAVATFVLMAFAAPFARTYPALLATRLVGGMTTGFIYTMSANIVGQVFPTARRGFATSAFVASGPGGFALAQLSAPTIATATGWPIVFVVYGLVAATGYAAFRATTPEPLRTGERLSPREFLRAVRNRPVLLVSLSSFCVYALYLFLNSWMPTYATEVLSISLAGAGAVTALVPATGILARPSGGLLSDYMGSRRRPVIAGSLLVATPLLFAVSQTRSPLVYGALLLLAGFVVQLGTGVAFTYAQELAHPGATGTSLTVFTALSFFGSFVSPIAGGWLIDTFSWAVAFAVFAGVGVAGIVSVAVVRES